ncbi:hypothetical protein [Xanthobacter sp. YC-JY1]|uniref:hypothetical protein n=1 Tax=Xanthobacter sp. YC-JY1 TaxID=2419844 RepID=UPI001F253012|nr:hypothetical protein [Xanthobacter sp. YC-JY1]UJX46637.1 acyl-CoA transferase [Xanthobacter sp. YC-JY1]
MTKREEVLSALLAALAAGLPACEVRRNAVVPARVPPGGLVILRDGDPGEGEPLLSPPSWYFEHRAEIELLVDAADAAARATALDAIAAAIGAILAADRTLGGACDYAQGTAPDVVDIPVENAPPLGGATLSVVLTYVSADPLA